jgi:hypothetical protein
MSTTIFPVETSTVTVTPETASTFEGTFVSGAVAAVAGGMSATIPMPVASLLTLLSPDFMDQMAIYCITPELVKYITIHAAYCAGALSPADYFTYLVKNWEIPVVETALTTWFKRCMTQTDLYAYFTQLPEAFVLKCADMIFDNSFTAFMLACATKNQTLAHKLLETGRALPDHISSYGSTPLMCACEAGFSDISLILLNCMNADIIDRINKFNMTALLYACKSGMSNIALAILATGKSNPGQINNHGETALTCVCHYGWSEVALAILATGMGKPEQVDNTGDTALACACNSRLSEVALAILATGMGNPEQVSNGGSTALKLATVRGLTPVVAELHRLGITE